LHAARARVDALLQRLPQTPVKAADDTTTHTSA